MPVLLPPPQVGFPAPYFFPKSSGHIPPPTPPGDGAGGSPEPVGGELRGGCAPRPAGAWGWGLCAGNAPPQPLWSIPPSRPQLPGIPLSHFEASAAAPEGTVSLDSLGSGPARS